MALPIRGIPLLPWGEIGYSLEDIWGKGENKSVPVFGFSRFFVSRFFPAVFPSDHQIPGRLVRLKKSQMASLASSAREAASLPRRTVFAPGQEWPPRSVTHTCTETPPAQPA